MSQHYALALTSLSGLHAGRLTFANDTRTFTDLREAWVAAAELSAREPGAAVSVVPVVPAAASAAALEARVVAIEAALTRAHEPDVLTDRLRGLDERVGHLSLAVERLALQREPGGAAEVDYAKVAEHIDLSDLAGEVGLSDLASELCMSDLAGEISLSDLVGELSMAEVANELSMSDLAQQVAEEVDVGGLVRDTVTEELQDKVRELRDDLKHELTEELKAVQPETDLSSLEQAVADVRADYVPRHELATIKAALREELLKELTDMVSQLRITMR